MSTKQYSCPTAQIRVVIAMQRHEFSGMGHAGRYVQIDYECSMESDCSHATTPACLTHRLNTGSSLPPK